ncbi:DUF1707 domain-containing protein [Sphaerisporangium flaviroseum]
MTKDAGIRAGDGDRDRVAEMLRTAVSEGRISFEELDDRLGRTYAAQTYGELDAIVADLPQAGNLAERRPNAHDAVGVLRLHTRGGRLKKIGHWVVPPLISARCTWGRVKLDFTQAQCHHREVPIEVDCGLGDIVIVVPVGWSVRSDEVTTSAMGKVHNRPPGPPAPDAVVVRLYGHVRIGDIWVRYRHRRG